MNTLFQHEPPPASKPPNARLRIVRLGLGIGVVYAACVAAIVHFMPTPHNQADLLIAGTLATLFSLVIVFGALMAANARAAKQYREKSRSRDWKEPQS